MADEILVLILNTTRATLSFTVWVSSCVKACVCVCEFAYTAHFRLTYKHTQQKLLPFIDLTVSRIATMERGKMEDSKSVDSFVGRGPYIVYIFV